VNVVFIFPDRDEQHPATPENGWGREPASNAPGISAATVYRLMITVRLNVPKNAQRRNVCFIYSLHLKHAFLSRLSADNTDAAFRVCISGELIPRRASGKAVQPVPGWINERSSFR